ncbi:Modular membrane protein with the N-terminus of MamE (with double CXXCH but no PDZ domain) and a TauE C-terminus domain (like in MamO) [Desulfamplus magnetovallimortis]|uniref:Probable membrane transporter protein n=2 Tax=Desulfamplus magnetovallimortis TaxID=1246637 RepID=L0R463_9BACT|nr:TSUP family transporter [Desulfamplus magnetovallimortis]AET24911.1 magnetosome protein [Desulfamplus magnetovallimortis BW-1]CCO06679.1 Modular membrane protein with the N-terminus of MamE (with double CXXCH but no PDZ domain) and a TauE C-terminus domain (like in MamO) [Desulfamplus magnetovallimortis BW-1]SLM32730.1 Modular membrane protein with the N-terminus of MamE (with double CXXCH but no PDZ domain) and a TauE C-terminus domain (like in MamO) [Desulfamplus magnetovallimortis]
MKRNLLIFTALILISVTSQAMGAVGNTLLLDLQETLSQAVAEIRPSVVSIRAKKMEQLPGGGAENALWYESIGSGFIVDTRGYVLTNLHVVEGAQTVEIKLWRSLNNLFTADVVDRNTSLDLALLRINANEFFPAAQLGNSETLKTGDYVICIGSPFGFNHTVTLGIISDLHREMSINGIPYKDMIQTDAVINEGNSGGPMIDIHGRVVGVGTAIYAPDGTYRGIGFAIPVNRTRHFFSRVTGAVIKAGSTTPMMTATGTVPMITAAAPIISTAATAPAAKEPVNLTKKMPNDRTHREFSDCTKCHTITQKSIITMKAQMPHPPVGACDICHIITNDPVTMGPVPVAAVNPLTGLHNNTTVPYGQFMAAQGQIPTAQGQFMTAQGQFMAAQGQFPNAQGQFPNAQGQFPNALGQFPNVQTQVPNTQGQYPNLQAQLPGTEAPLPSIQGQFAAPQTEFSTTTESYSVLFSTICLKVGFFTFLSSIIFSMLGLGGGFVYVPLLLSCGIDFYTAATTSLVMLTLSQISALFNFSRSGLLDIRLAAVLEFPTMIGAFLGGMLAHHFNVNALSIMFSCVLFLASYFMMQERMEGAVSGKRSPISLSPFVWRHRFNGNPVRIDLAVAAPLTFVVGYFGGMLGLAAGWLKIPIMVILFNIPIKIAIATSSLMVPITGLAGFLGHSIAGHFDARLALTLSAITIVGAQIGSRISIGTPSRLLRFIFAFVLSLVGVWMILRVF